MSKNRSFAFWMLLPAALCIIAMVSAAARPPQSKAPDLSGAWEQDEGMTNGAAGRGFSREVPPLQPAMMAKYNASRAGLKSLADKGLDELDPLTYCFPPGAPRSMIMPYPFEIVQQGEAVYILFEYGSGIRIIHTRRTKHPDSLMPSWMGDSVGSWQGDTLVVDTIGFRPETWIDPTGVPHSDALHMVERFRRTNRNTLEVQFTFDDPMAFTKPWGGMRVYHLGDADIAPYFVCEENLPIGAPPPAFGK